MFRANYRKLKDTEGLVGGITNETRFHEHNENRTKKRFTIPGINLTGTCTMEQGWNERARKRDVIRMTISQDDHEVVLYFNREDFEQLVFSMAQEDETIKYIRSEARAQRKYSES